MTTLAEPIAVTETIPVVKPRRRWNWRRIVSLTVLTLLIAAFLVIMAKQFAPAISEPDDNGYFAQGTLLFDTGHTFFKMQSDAQYIGMHWLLTPDGYFVSRYSPGLAVVIGAIDKVFGHRAATCINLAFATGTLAGMYFLTRRVSRSTWLALIAVAMLGANPVFIHHALSGDSHMSVACVLVWGLFFVITWSLSGRWLHALLAGFFLGCIPVIRYPDAVMGLGCAIFVVSVFIWRWRLLKHFPVLLLGAAITIFPLMLRNKLLFGSWIKTGYELTNEQTGFTREFFKAHAFQYIQMFNSSGAGLLFGLGLVGMITMLCTRNRRAIGAMLFFVATPMLILYMAYYWAPAMMPAATMRFLLPIIPVFVLAGVWLVGDLVRSRNVFAKILIPLGLLAMQGLWSFPDARDQSTRLREAKTSLAVATNIIREVAQKGDLIVTADRDLLQHLDFVRDWKLADASRALGRGGMGFGGGGPGGNNRRGFFGGGPGGPGMGGPGMGGPGGPPPMGAFGGPGGPDANNDDDTPSPQQKKKTEFLATLYQGTTSKKEEKFVDDLRKWADGKSIYLVGYSDQTKSLLGGAARSDELKVVKTVKVPAPQGRGFGAMGGMMRRNMPGGRGGRANETPSTQPVERDLVIVQWTPSVKAAETTLAR